MTHASQTNHRRIRRWGLGVSAVGLILFGPGVYELVRLSAMQRQLDCKLAALAAEQGRLTQEQERLQSDPAYVEGLIRSTFKVAKPGEYVIPLDADPSRRETRETR